METVGPRINRPSGQEMGNPSKLAEAVIQVAELPNPPLRILLGKDAYPVATAKLGDMLNDIENWKETTMDTDFEE
ncbi:hypothetical protein [Paenibacillus favisporus]|uniref:hypothetical protein n=1 Tax=Paenibacillus favisporus TaxID=221028 RepID=UPI003D2D0747